ERLVLPIPPGTHWSDVKPIILPGTQLALPEKKERCGGVRARVKAPTLPRNQPLTTSMVGMRFESTKPSATEKAAKAKKALRAKMKNDPKHVAAARELRDRYLEHVNSAGGASALPDSRGKYQVSRQIEAPQAKFTPMLAA